MKDEIIAIYCLCDDILKAMNHQEDSQQQISDAEVMTTAIVATLYDSGNFEKGRKAMSQPQYFYDSIILKIILHMYGPLTCFADTDFFFDNMS